MAVASIKPGGGGDYTSFSAWEAALSANPASSETASLDEAADGGAFTINVSNTNTVTLTVTVADGFRHYDQTGWPNLIRVLGTAGRIVSTTATCITVSTNDVTIDNLFLLSDDSSAGTGIDINPHNNVHVGSTVILARGANARGVEFVSSATWDGTQTLTFYNVVMAGQKEAIQASDADSTWKNLTIMGYPQQSNYGAFGVRSHQINRQPTTTMDSCVALGPAVCYGTAGGGLLSLTNCASSDATGTTGKINLVPLQVLRRCGHDDWNPELINDTNGQAGPDGALWMFGAEGGAFNSISPGSAISIVAAAAQEDSYGVTATITGSMSNNLTQFPRFNNTITQTATYHYMEFRLRSGFTMTDGDQTDQFEFTSATNGALIRFRVRRSGANYQIRAQLKVAGDLNGTNTTLTVGTWYKIKVKVDYGDNPGTADWWVAAVGASFGAATDSWTGIDMSSFGGVAGHQWDITGVDAGTSGNIDYDTIVWGTADVDENDGTGGWGDSVEGNASFEGTDNSGDFTTDINGTTRSSWNIGAWEISGGAPPTGIVVLRRRRSC